MTAYYEHKLPSLREIFGTEEVRLEGDALVVRGRRYPIVDDVIVALDPEQYPPALRARLAREGGETSGRETAFAEDIQFTFGEEWQRFPEILPEHEREFNEYFDLVDLDGLADKRVCDLGCGIGRWGHFLKGRCRELMMVDFSEAIFVARGNHRDNPSALFFMADIKRLPFGPDFADFLYCIGVLHHIPYDHMMSVRELRPCAPLLLIYLYYALDNRPAYFRLILGAVTLMRNVLARTRSTAVRAAFSWLGAVGIYKPLVILGHVMDVAGMGRYVPLYEGYRGKSIRRLQQDVYDRFFTRIEQRASRKDIYALRDTFSEITISDGIPYWHFLCKR